eukprot:8988421-Alexandrium_andersonii.AAC.1
MPAGAMLPGETSERSRVFAVSACCDCAGSAAVDDGFCERGRCDISTPDWFQYTVTESVCSTGRTCSKYG